MNGRARFFLRLFISSPSRAFFLAPIYFLAPATQAISGLSSGCVLYSTIIIGMFRYIIIIIYEVSTLLRYPPAG